MKRYYLSSDLREAKDILLGNEPYHSQMCPAMLQNTIAPGIDQMDQMELFREGHRL